jgi:anti-sigma regulatory factor (Ser/Thr protein kinase)
MVGRIQFPATSDALRRVRGEARSVAVQLGASANECDAVALVVDELVNNAIEHGASYRRAGLDLIVQVGLRDGRVRVEFVDPEMPEPTVRELAASLSQAANGMPSLESERGRGLFLLSIYLEELAVGVAKQGGLHLGGVIARS